MKIAGLEKIEIFFGGLVVWWFGGLGFMQNQDVFCMYDFSWVLGSRGDYV